LKKHGEPLKMNWAAAQGKTGKCHVYIDTYKKKDGSDGQSNKIRKFYAYDENVQTLSPQTPYSQSQQYQQAPQPQQYQYPQTNQYQQPAQGGGWKAGTF